MHGEYVHTLGLLIACCMAAALAVGILVGWVLGRMSSGKQDKVYDDESSTSSTP